MIMRERSSWQKLFYKGSCLVLLMSVACRSVHPKEEPIRRDTLLYLFSGRALDAVEEMVLMRRKVARQLMPAVYRLEVTAKYRYRTDQYQGTGWCGEGGYIWTCRHLFPEQADLQIEVWDHSGECHTAGLVWRDSLADVALLRVVQPCRERLAFRRDSVVEIGETVLAVGAPLGLSSTLQEGFVSAPLRLISMGKGAQHAFIQLSLPAQPGSSGSPVVDRQGQVIGMLSDIATLSGGYEGISFAIPAQVLYQVWERYRSFASNDPKGYR